MSDDIIDIAEHRRREREGPEIGDTPWQASGAPA